MSSFIVLIIVLESFKSTQKEHEEEKKLSESYGWLILIFLQLF